MEPRSPTKRLCARNNDRHVLQVASTKVEDNLVVVCNVIFLSTTSDEDLSLTGGGLFRLYRVALDERETAVRTLKHPHRWYLECRYGGCSCHFRHSDNIQFEGSSPVAVDPTFGPPEEWCPEDDDDLESTAAFYDLLLRLIGVGHQVDVVDVWNGDDSGAVRTMSVSLSSVPREHFRFFESYRFDLTA